MQKKPRSLAFPDETSRRTAQYSLGHDPEMREWYLSFKNGDRNRTDSQTSHISLESHLYSCLSEWK